MTNLKNHFSNMTQGEKQRLFKELLISFLKRVSKFDKKVYTHDGKYMKIDSFRL